MLYTILLVGAFLRALFYNTSPMFMDTAYYSSLGMAVADGDWLQQVDSQGDKPPLFFYIQGLFFILFGKSDSVALAPSYLSGVVSIYFMYLIGKKIRDKQTGLVAAMLFSCSPASIDFSTMAFIDSAFLLSYIISLHYLFSKKILKSGFFIAISFALKQTILAFIPMFLMYILIESFQNEKKGLLLKNSVKILLPLSIFFSVIFYWNLFLSSNRLKSFSYIHSFIQSPESSNFVGTISQRIDRFQFGFEQLHNFSFTLFIPIALAALILLFFRHKEKGNIFLIWLVFSSIYFGFLVVFVARKYTGTVSYILPILPATTLILSVFFSDLIKLIKLENSKNKLAFILFFIILIRTISPMQNLASSRENDPSKNFSSYAHEIKRLANNGFIYQREQGWMLRYYLYGYNYESYKYDIDAFDEAIKNINRHPYKDHFLLLYRYTFQDQSRIQQKLETSGYKLDLISKSHDQRFYFFQINPMRLPEVSSEKISSFIRKILNKNRIENLSIDSSAEKISVTIDDYPFGELSSTHTSIQIVNPQVDFAKSSFYQWPIFKDESKISITHSIELEDISNKIINRYKLETLKLSFSSDGVSVLAEREHQLDLSLQFEFDENYIYSRVEKIKFNNYPLTWFAKLFKNHLIPRVPLVYDPSFNIKLYKIEIDEKTIKFSYR